MELMRVQTMSQSRVALQGKLCGPLLGQARVVRAKLRISSLVKLNLTPLSSGDWELSSQHALQSIVVSHLQYKFRSQYWMQRIFRLWSLAERKNLQKCHHPMETHSNSSILQGDCSLFCSS
jgi:hypothetical protein